MRLFVSVASYRDSELPKTLASLLDKARYKKDLSVAVVSQHLDNGHPDLSFITDLRYTKMHIDEARGAGYARKLAMESYNGEDYIFQIDSHMRFEEDWDHKLITMLGQAREVAETDKVILSQFPAPYKLTSRGEEFYPQNDPVNWSGPSWTSVYRKKNVAWSGMRQKIDDLSVPHESHTILAANVFADGRFAEEVPYDERISFMGEELCMSIRAYTRGWKIYAPNEMVCYHFYVRSGHPKVWDSQDNKNRVEKWPHLETVSYQIQRDVLTGKETGVYGIESKELYDQYQKMIGIDFTEFYGGT